MTETTASLEVRSDRRPACVLEIEGEMTGFSELALKDAYTEASGEGVKAVILDFSGLEYMNSGGIGFSSRCSSAPMREPAAVRVRAHRPLPADLRG